MTTEAYQSLTMPADIKEHVAITIMGATSSDSALAISIFAAQDLYYNVKPNAATAIFTLIGSQVRLPSPLSLIPPLTGPTSSSATASPV